MVITVEEVMESGHFYGSPDLPPEPFQCACFLTSFEVPLFQWNNVLGKQTRVYLKTKRHNALNSCCWREIHVELLRWVRLWERQIRFSLFDVSCPFWGVGIKGASCGLKRPCTWTKLTMEPDSGRAGLVPVNERPHGQQHITSHSLMDFTYRDLSSVAYTVPRLLFVCPQLFL